ncbi:hypothetical protein LCL95_10265 [Bacillus timonensis]|nr:hypothetical protein [Bacillus timonensis]
MQKLKILNVLLVLFLVVTLLTPFSSASASMLKKVEATPFTPEMYCTNDTNGIIDDTYNQEDDAYNTEPVQVRLAIPTHTTLYLSWQYNGEWTNTLSYNLYLNSQLVENITKDYYYIEGLTEGTSYEVTIEVLKDGSPTGETGTITTSTWDPPSGDIVSIEDSNLESKIRNRLNIQDRPLQESDLAYLTYVYGDNSGITSLKGLEYAINLVEIEMSGNEIADLSPLSNLTSLESILLMDNHITDVSPLAKLSNLKRLGLDINYISDISSLSDLTKLESLNLSFNSQITNINTLLSLPSLKTLGLHEVTLDDTAKKVVDSLRSNGVNVWADYVTEYIGWHKVCDSWLYFDSVNDIYTGWLLDSGKWYYLSTDDKYGQMSTGWDFINGKWYYFNGSGAMQTGWIKDGGSWYHLSSSGAMSTGWVKDGATWYYLTGSGAMKTGWLNSGSKWYHLQASGAMSVGWKKINNKWYYFYSQGHMAANTVIDGYKVGKDGAWIR